MKIRTGSPAIKHVVIGTGPLGRATADALSKMGNQVEMVNRSGSVIEPPVGVSIVAGDLGNLDSMRPIVKDAASIYFCAQPPYHRWAQEFPALQDAAIALAEEAGAALIVAENLYGYGAVRGPMTENMPMNPNSRKGAVRATMHESLMAAHRAGRVQVAVARGSDFFGPYVDGSAVGARAFKAIVANKAVEYTGNLDAPHSYTFVEDFGKALAILGTQPASLGEIWHVPNAPTMTSRSFFDLAFKRASGKTKFRKVSVMEMKMLGMFIPPLREMIEMVYEFEKPFVVDDSKFKKAFADIATPSVKALDETIAWTIAGSR
ncbi:MAG: NAD-dependent epimerase/dehydratase family protein [Sphingomonadaceae bacterium]